MWLFVLAIAPEVAQAQWLSYPTPGIPRLANGAPNLKAPAPRTPDGKPDFSGMPFANVPSRDFCREKDCIQEERMADLRTGSGVQRITVEALDAVAPVSLPAYRSWPIGKAKGQGRP